jgi:hypothetical protein
VGEIWQTNIANKVEKCDILEIYNESETDSLLKINGYNWKTLLNLDNTTSYDLSEDIVFSNKVSNINESLTDNQITKNTLNDKQNEEEINFDEI